MKPNFLFICYANYYSCFNFPQKKNEKNEKKNCYKDFMQPQNQPPQSKV